MPITKSTFLIMPNRLYDVFDWSQFSDTAVYLSINTLLLSISTFD